MNGLIEWSKDDNHMERCRAVRRMSKMNRDGLSSKDAELFQKRIFELSYDENDDVRLAAVSELCPCRVRDDIEAVWNRIFELVDDTNAGIRSRVLHILCDGSPEKYADRISDAIDKLHKDKDRDVRKIANRVMGSIKATGKWNIL